MRQIEIPDDFDLGKTASCGQCFRAKEIENGLFRYVSGKYVIYIKDLGDHRFSVSCTDKEWEKIWTGYFDLERSYRDLYLKERQKHDFVRKAMDFGKGIRVLRQDPWEMLVTFILSQRKSIPAISKSVESLAERYGHLMETDHELLYSFPTPKDMADATVEELQECGLGYRAPYVRDAVEKVLSGSLDLEAISEYSDADLFEALQTVRGVGKKVANCICLFGYGRMERVPVDVWISRTLAEDFDGKDPFPLFERNAGIIQQYLFYYKRYNRV